MTHKETFLPTGSSYGGGTVLLEATGRVYLVCLRSELGPFPPAVFHDPSFQGTHASPPFTSSPGHVHPPPPTLKLSSGTDLISVDGGTEAGSNLKLSHLGFSKLRG